MSSEANAMSGPSARQKGLRLSLPAQRSQATPRREDPVVQRHSAPRDSLRHLWAADPKHSNFTSPKEDTKSSATPSPIAGRYPGVAEVGGDSPNAETEVVLSVRDIEAQPDTPSVETHDTSFGDYAEEIDEISLLGLAAMDIPDVRERARTPDESLDQLSLKIESPGNLSIEKLMAEHEATMPYEIPQEILETKTDIVNNEAFSEAADAIIRPRSPQRTSPSPELRDHDTSISRIEFENIPLAPQHEANSLEIVGEETQSLQTPNLHRYLPFVDEDDINTPARPMEEVYQFELLSQSTPVKIPMQHNIVQRTPPHKEDAFLDTMNKTVRIDPELQILNPAGGQDSFASTTADVVSEATPSSQGRLSPEHVNPSLYDKQSLLELESDQVKMSTPQSGPPRDTVLRDISGRKTLGSAIRINGTVPRDLSTNMEHTPLDRPLIVKAAPLRLASPEVRQRITTAVSEPRARKRASTPPPKKRHSMDIPLARAMPSIELWENHGAVVRLAQQRSPSPKPTENSPPLTPPAKARTSMDVPLSRERATTEVWHDEGHASRKKRRTLLSPEPVRRKSQTDNLIVDESPQRRATLVSPRRSSRKSSPERYQRMPKLDFGFKVQHSRTLSDAADFPDFETPLRDVVNSEPTTERFTNLTRLPSISGQQEMAALAAPLVVPIKTHHSTPRSSKLRRLARHLAQEHVVHSGEPDLSDPEVPTLAQAEMTPKSSRRKQLSDDVDLDFEHESTPQLLAVEPASDDAQSVHVTPPQPAELPLADPETNHAPLANEIATPVFTLKRKRQQPTPVIVDHIAQSPLVHPLVSSPSKKKPKRTAGGKVRIINLATFGALPQVMPRARRERKKPGEFWKIQDEPKVSPIGVPASSVPASSACKTHPRASNVAVKEVPVTRPMSTEVATLSTQKQVKHKPRPSDFKGPISSHRKIKASTKTASDPSTGPGSGSHPFSKKPRTHDFDAEA